MSSSESETEEEPTIRVESVEINSESEEEEEEEEEEEPRKGRKIVCIADGTSCTNISPSGLFSIFTCICSWGIRKEERLCQNTIPQQLFDNLEQSDEIVKMYLPGCGTGGGAQSYYDFMTGDEIPKLLVRVLEFIGSNYRPGDELILFGYSRGAFLISIVTKFFKFFHSFNEDQKCLPNGLAVWNNVKLKKLVYDLSKDNTEELEKTFTKKELRSNFKKMPLSQIKLIGLMDVCAQYTNFTCIDAFNPLCGCLKYFQPLHTIPLHEKETFGGVGKVMNFVPREIVYSVCPYIPCCEMFPSSVIKKDEKSKKSKKNKKSGSTVEQYILDDEVHYLLSNDENMIRLLHEEFDRIGLRLTKKMKPIAPGMKPSACYLMYCCIPMFTCGTEKKIGKDWVVTKIEKKKKKKEESSSGSDEELEEESESESSD